MLRWIFWLLLLGNGFYFMWMETSGARLAAQKPVAPPPVAPGLVLLSETVPEQPTVAMTAEPKEGELPEAPAPTEDVPEEPDAVTACWQLGPFDRGENARIAGDTAADMGWEVSRQTVEVPKPSGYWVYTGPYESRDLALRRLQQYKDDGVDSFLITDGGLANAISLGLFSSRDRAAKAQARRRKQGYAAKIYVLERSDEQQLVVLTGAQDEASLNRLVAALKTELKLDEIQKKTCI